MDILDVDKLMLFIGFVMPGFIAMKLYDTIHPSEVFEPTKFVTEAITYSCINYGLWALPLYFLVENQQLTSEHPFTTSIVGILVFIVSPIAMALGIDRIRQTGIARKIAPHPTLKPWDFVFKQGKRCWAIITLEDGTTIAGKYAGNSFTSNYPAPEQIYLEECWEMNKDGGFERERTGSAGIIVVSSSIRTLELFKWEGDEDER